MTHLTRLTSTLVIAFFGSMLLIPSTDAQQAGERETRLAAISCREKNLEAGKLVETQYVDCLKHADQFANLLADDADHRNYCDFVSRAATTDGRLDGSVIQRCRANFERIAREKAAADLKVARQRQVEEAQEMQKKRNEEEVAQLARLRADEERQRQHQLAEQRREEAADRAAADRSRKALEQLKTKCGNAYMHIEVGMAWPIVSECSGPYAAVGQITTAKGVVSQFRSRLALVSIGANGKVVQWLALR